MNPPIIFKDKLLNKGRNVTTDAIVIAGNVYTISSGLFTTAKLKRIWHDDVSDPTEVIHALQTAPKRIDMLQFWQRIPNLEPAFRYFYEIREIAAIPISNYDNWWNRQISSKTRNMVRKSEKRGVQTSEIIPDDPFFQGVVEIYNESPVKRGKRFWHYGKDFTTVKQELLRDSDQSIFLAAHYKEELIGFIKLLVADQSAMITMILDKQSHRDKSPMNGLIAKAVEVCSNRNIPFITYTVWRRGDHGKFQERNGFTKFPVPEYFVPLTLRGKLALRLGLHRGLRGAIPETVYVRLLALRASWYSILYGRKTLKSDNCQ